MPEEKKDVIEAKPQEDGTVENKDTTENTPEGSPAVKEDQTMAQIQEGATPTPPATEKKDETVGLDKYMKEKKARQTLEKEVANLRKLVDGGASKEEVNDEIKALADEYEDVDPEFLQKLTKVIRSQSDKEWSDRFEKLEKSVETKQESEKETKINAAFKTHFDKALEAMPEYAKVVDPEVIKTLSLDPKNANKTFPQIIEETYGKFVTGKNTMETKTQPGGGKEPESIDYAKAKRDPEYFKTILANPRLKEMYNKDIHKRIGS